MSYRYKSSRLIIPPPPAPLPSGSVYSNPKFPRADFADAAGNNLSLTFKELRAILVHKTQAIPDVAFDDLRQAFRDTIRITPHTHSDVNIEDIKAAYNPVKPNQP